MRKRDITIGVICFIIGFVVTSLLLNIGKQYSRDGYVELNTGKEIVLNDTWGHKWAWAIEEEEKEEIKALTKGEKVNLIFDTQGTYDFVDDDVLVGIKKY